MTLKHIRPAVITGKNGQLSVALQKEMKARKLPYIALGSGELDIRDKEKVIQTIEYMQPTVIFHTAAWTDVDGAESNYKDATNLNVHGTRNMLEAGEKTGASFVYISTDYVFNGKTDKPYSVEDNPSPINHYGYTKWLGEEYVRNYMNPWWIIRTSWVYGGEGKSFVRSIAEKAMGSEKINVVEDQIGSPTHVKDLAASVVDVWKNESGVYHICNYGCCSRYSLAQYIYEKVGGDKNCIIPTKTTMAANVARRPSYSVLDMENLKDSNIATPRHWSEGIDDFLQELGWMIRKSN